MRIDPLYQLTVAAAALVLGAAAGLLYDLLRALRRLLRSVVFEAVTDLFFCIAAGAGLFVLAFAAGGKQRIFMSVLAALGMVLYLRFPSRLVLPVLERVFGFFAGILRVLLRPLRLLAKKVDKNARFIKKSFETALKQYIISKRVNRRHMRRVPDSRVFREETADETQKGRYHY